MITWTFYVHAKKCIQGKINVSIVTISLINALVSVYSRTE